uniref:LIM and SH3 domain protein 1 n=1 Tax=Stegastes partitus TaxID=144197 RepID=A0A3B4Z858_9TELE
MNHETYWHKGCFSCEVCKMALSMNNYKGFEKKPYCSMHYPKTSFTIVTDTPENLRLKQQSMLNSQALYKEDFERNKGKGFSVVADTPEMQRVKKTQDQISHVRRLQGASETLKPLNLHLSAVTTQNSRPSLRPLTATSKRYQAMYSYVAAEADEVSLQEGDLILDVEPIDEGWVFGCNQRTGQRGMLPANYVRPV